LKLPKCVEEIQRRRGVAKEVFEEVSKPNLGLKKKGKKNEKKRGEKDVEGKR
jgi:hypothetical protein